MSSDLMTRVKDKYVTVDGLKLRYIEEGEGPAVLLLHGASLGSSADAINATVARYLGAHRPTSTTVEVVRLAADPRLVVELAAVAVVPE